MGQSLFEDPAEPVEDHEDPRVRTPPGDTGDALDGRPLRFGRTVRQ